MSNWYDSDNPSTVVRGATWRVVLWVLAILAVVAVVSGLVWGFKVATSDVKGRGDAVVQKNSAENRVAAQERFEDLYQQVIAADRKIGPAKAAVKANPTQVNQTNLTGLQNFCVQTVADYNAEARKYSKRDFRAVDLPQEISEFSETPQTDCK